MAGEVWYAVLSWFHHHNTLRARFTTLCVVLAFVLALPAIAVAEDCEALSYSGMCEGTVHIWCEYGEVEELDCASMNMKCDWDETNGYFGCIPDESDASLCALPEFGLCDGESNSVSWCDEQGEIQTLECQEGMTCGWNENEEYMDCIPEEYGGMTEEGAMAPEPSPEDAGSSRESARDPISDEEEDVQEASDPAQSVERRRGPVPLRGETSESRSESIPQEPDSKQDGSNTIESASDSASGCQQGSQGSPWYHPSCWSHSWFLSRRKQDSMIRY